VIDVGVSIESDQDLSHVVGGGWTLGEHLVHIAAWERRYARLASRQPHQSFPRQWERFNDAVFEHWHGADSNRMRAEYLDAQREIVAAVSALPAGGDRDRPKLLVGWNLGMAPRHYREHATILLEHVGRPKPPPWRGRIVD
jgi:hypothetical protein